MKQSLTIKTGLHLAMTPALRQGIELLNLPSLEIEAKIQETLDSNIMLEEDESSNETETLSSTSDDITMVDLPNEVMTSLEGGLEEAEQSPAPETNRSAIISDDVPDASEDEGFFEDWLPPTVARDRDRQFEGPRALSDSSLPREKEVERSSLRQHLLGQLELVTVSDEQKAISMAIIDFLDDDGFLRVPVEEILMALKREENDLLSEESWQSPVSLYDVESNLEQIVQNFEPNGVGARTVQECLVLQLLALDEATPFRDEALISCGEFLDLLSEKDFSTLKSNLGVDDADFVGLIHLIQSLNPRPGAAYADHNAQYIIPDVYVIKMNGVWQVESNSSLCPALRINSYYESLINNTQTEFDNKTLQKHLADAKFFMKSLRQRNETVLDVARAIVLRQVDFFERGESAMKPMVLQDIAEEVGRNASTISRATTGKYMDTPRGTFELKYFFDSHVRTEDGGTVSSVAIRNHIQKIVAAENEGSPLSDQKISELLAGLGFKVARRTVTKYREFLSIPSSSQRRQSLTS